MVTNITIKEENGIKLKTKTFNFDKFFNSFCMSDKTFNELIMEILKFLKNLDIFIDVNEIYNKEDLEDIFSSDLVFIDDGVFIVSRNYINGFDKTFTINLIKSRGIWNAQGINNHIHLIDYSKNTEVQRAIGYFVISIFITMIISKNYYGDYVFYLNGKDNLSLCIYQPSGVDSEFLSDFDRMLDMENCSLTEIGVEEDGGVTIL